MIELIFNDVSYGSPGDERAFFEWLNRISSVTGIVGRGTSIYVSVKGKRISNDDLREILAIMHRYRVDMSQLEVFLSKTNKSWFFLNEDAYWHSQVFGNMVSQNKV